MLEARFDDLTGVSASFRLVEPVGVLEATRADEVVPTLEAAQAAAGRGLWVAGFVAYEAAPGLDPRLAVRDRDPDDPFASLPLAWFAMFEGAEETTLPVPRDDGFPPAAEGTWRPTTPRERYEAAVGRVRELIAAGETYQVNHTMRLRSRVEGDPRGLYRDLCYAQRGAYAAYLDLGRYRILSASPELFFEVRGGAIATRPMKGTAPRGRWPAEDREVAEQIVASRKDRAENAMIVDLLRNDLGRIGETGSVTWNDTFRAERYETVWQLTTTVSARLRPGTGLPDVFRALFPSGSVTGAPKVRTMELIAELEDSPRGVYCGAVGYLSPEGSDRADARFNVAIRTVALDTATGTAEYGAGGGITWDSDAAAEYDEAVAKARVLTARRPDFELLETMRFDPGTGVLHVDLHLDRLAASADYFGFTFDRTDVEEAVEKAVASAPPDHAMRVRLSLRKDGTVRVVATPLSDDPDAVRVAIDIVGQDPRDVFLFHKTSRRQRYDEARRRHPEAEDVLLVNDRGEVTESTIANVAARIDGRWVTPPVEAGLLPGVGRAVALAEGRLTDAPLSIEDVRSAEELALISDTRGWRRAVLEAS
ncbi:MAG TPA: aminodeoxychorismate synthase component I [Actinomycetota bacterium]|nr:aminodeoxychorismate synthase component I [Actinomycetota bacterium]